MDRLQNIVVIEDEPPLLNLLIVLLKKAGFNAVGFKKGRPALEYIPVNDPDMILVDINLPDMSGIEICSELKTDVRTRHIPVVIITSLPTMEVVVAAKKAGANAFFSKMEVNFKNLLEKIREVMEQVDSEKVIPGSAGSKIKRRKKAGGAEIGKKTGKTGDDFRRARNKAEKEIKKGDAFEKNSLRARIGHVSGKVAKDSYARPETVKVALKKIKELKSLPFIAVELARKASSAESSASDLLEIVDKDQALTYKILKVANSPFFSSSQKITTVKRAIVRLGFEHVKEIALSAAILDNLDGEERAIDRVSLWEHSLLTSIIARDLARLTRGIPPESAFIASFLHDFGKAIFDDFLEEMYSEVVEYSREKVVPFHTSELRLLGINHATLFSELKVTWNLPDKLYFPIISHHDTWDELKRLDVEYEDSRLILVVKTADLLAKTSKIGSSGDDFLVDIPSWVQKALGLEDDIVEGIMERAGQSVIELEKALNVNKYRRDVPMDEDGGGEESKESGKEQMTQVAEKGTIAYIDTPMHIISPLRRYLSVSGFRMILFHSTGELAAGLSNYGLQDTPVLVAPEAVVEVWETLSAMGKDKIAERFPGMRFIFLNCGSRETLPQGTVVEDAVVERVPIPMSRLEKLLETGGQSDKETAALSGGENSGL